MMKSIERADLENIRKDMQENLECLEKKYGIKITVKDCLFNTGENADFPVSIMLDYCPEDNIKKNRFGLFCDVKELDRKYGLTSESFGKTYSFGCHQIKIIDFLYNGRLTNCVTAVVDGEVYQIPPMLAGKLECGVTGDEKLENQLESIMAKQTMAWYKWSPRPSDLHLDFYIRLAEKYQLPLKSEDFGKQVMLHGKSYTVNGIVDFYDWNNSGNFHTGCNVAKVYVDDSEMRYAVPIANVLNALGCL